MFGLLFRCFFDGNFRVLLKRQTHALGVLVFKKLYVFIMFFRIFDLINYFFLNFREETTIYKATNYKKSLQLE